MCLKEFNAVYNIQINGSILQLFSGTVQLHLSGLFGTARYPDKQKVQIIGFFFEIN
jgi:hypothetical protein